MIVGDMEIRLRADIARLQRDMDAARRTVGDATTSMSRAADMAKSALAGIAAGIGLAQIAQMSDAYAKFTAQLKLASLSTREYSAAYADVKRIATQSTQGLQETGVLYARIANGTRELGVAQKQVAAITETVNLSLLVSGATASEAASAQLQLSQAFASGTLRGEEFNAVNEAAPRLMLALADGIGVPVGALKKMAEEGAITSKIMADTLPNALGRLRQEAKEVQTIAGAFTVLKNNMMEFVGIQSNASGAVSALTGAIGFLSTNLAMIAGAVATLTVAKLGTWLANMATSAYATAAANRALAASTLAAAVSTTEAAAVAAAAKLAEAQANVRATASAAALAAARVTELRAAVLAASGAASLAIATNGLIPAQARAIALAEANAVALAAQAVAANAATTASLASTAAITAQTVAGGIAARTLGVLRGAMTMLGGPIGAVITLLGLAATAWMVWGNKSKEASEKAAVAVDESTTEMIARLDKQIEKLRERNRLQEAEPRLKGLNELSDADKDGLARAKSRLDAVRAGTGEFAGEDQMRRQLAEIDIAHNYEMALKKIAEAQDETTRAANRGRDAKLADWYSQNGTAAQKLAAELDALRKQFGTIPPEMEKLVRAKYADKGGPAAIKQEATAYQSLMTAIAEKVAANKLELAGYDKLSESQKATIKLDAEIATGKNKLGPASIESARAQIAVMADQEESIKAINAALEMKALAEKSTIKNDDEMYAKIAKGTSDIDEQIAKMKEQIETIGLTEVAVVDLAIAKANAAMATGPASYAELVALDAQITKLTELRALTDKKQVLDLSVGSGVTQAKDLLDIMAAMDDAAKSAATGMAASFGKVGTAIGGLTTAMTGYSRTQAAIAAQLAAATKDAGGDQGKIQRANALAAQQSAQAQVRSYGDMASAAKGFFKDNSAGYKAMEGAEKAFRAAEMAMAIQAMVKKIFFKEGEVAANLALNGTKLAGEATTTAASTGLAATEASAWGITAVVKAMASLPFPANLAAGAATLAAVVAIGAKLVGSIGGAGGGMSAADAQKQQGTGGVFGDDTAKTDSIMRSLELLEGNSGSLIPINRGMLTALRSIEASMKGLTNLIVRAPGIVNGTNMGIETGQLNIGKPTDAISGVMTQVTKALFGPGFGDKIAGFINNLWGKTKQSIVDSGIQFGGSVNDLQAGRGYNQFASVDTTKSSWFGLSKKTTNSVQTQGLNEELSAQFGMIFTGLESALTAAAVGLGIGADHVTKTLDALTLDVTSISLKGLTGDALTEALNAVLSQAMDQMSEAVFPDLDAFRQVGEGYSETIIRLASNYATVDSVLSSLNMDFGAVGVGSLAARENLIALSGGIDAMSEQATGFANNFLTEAQRLAPVQKYVTEELARMGYAGVATREQFRDVVLGLNVSTEAGAATYAGLMALQEAFALVVPAIEASSVATKDAAAILDERRNLQQRYDELTMTSTQLLEQQRAALDESNRALFDSIIGAQEVKAANEAVATSMKSYEDRMNTLVQASMTLDQRRAAEIAALDATVVPLARQVHAMEDQASAAAATAAAIEAANARVKAIAAEGAGLDRELMQILGDTAGLRKLELEGLDPLNRAKKQEIYDTQDRIAAAALKAKADQDAAKVTEDAAKAQQSAAEQIRSAWRSITDSLFDEVARIKGLLNANTGMSLADAQTAFSIRTAQARAGDETAAKLLPQLSKTLLDLAEENALTSLDLRRFQAQTMGSLTETAKLISGQYGFAIPGSAADYEALASGPSVSERNPMYTAASVRQTFVDPNAAPAASGAALIEAALDRLAAAVNNQQESLNKIGSSSKKSADILETVTEGGNAMRQVAL